MLDWNVDFRFDSFFCFIQLVVSALELPDDEKACTLHISGLIACIVSLRVQDTVLCRSPGDGLAAAIVLAASWCREGGCTSFAVHMIAQVLTLCPSTPSEQTVREDAQEILSVVLGINKQELLACSPSLTFLD